MFEEAKEEIQSLKDNVQSIKETTDSIGGFFKSINESWTFIKEVQFTDVLDSFAGIGISGLCLFIIMGSKRSRKFLYFLVVIYILLKIGLSCIA